jgi:hypothetical protein
VSAPSAVGGAAAQVRGVADSRPVGWVARVGLTARGLVYVLIGVLALTVARGGHKEVDQKGALQQVLTHSYGSVLVGAMAAGFAAYALWRLSEAAFGVTGEGRAVGPRIQSLVRGLIYAALAVSAVSLLQGSHSSQAGQQSEITARVMHHSGGRWLVGLVGLAIAAAGLILAWQGVRLRFMKYFPAGALKPRVRALVRALGGFGTVARGLVFAVVGVLVVVAAERFEPSKAGGLDEALKTLRDRSYGQLILTVIALGLIAFGMYGLLEARYRRV